MNLRDLQLEVGAWALRNFPTAEKWEPLVGMQEELGELSHAFLKIKQGIRTNEDHATDMKDAVADLLIFTAHFCSLNNIDLDAALELTWAEVRQRNWKQNPETGK